ncbi:MAG TPA: glycine--tRNA ligase subunit beta, partial [Burkholderiales bacterium]|nr:glycine--tRNA ligase subunit beta [Burkholderiales bacterium]
MRDTLLVELLTEELPPKSLRAVSEAFARALCAELERDGFATRPIARAFATPRRLAVKIADVAARSPDVEREVQGPPVNAPAQAVAGFARKNGVAVEALERRAAAKGELFVARVRTAGRGLDEVLAQKVQEALKALPIPKLMRWGDGDAQFIRPVHGLVLMHGAHAVPGTVLGVSSGSSTRGHRFLAGGSIALANADDYESTLERDARVVADFDARRGDIDRQLAARSAEQGGSLGNYQDLLEEVTALVEQPAVYVGSFDAQFLEVPQECLILTMRQNQKYFPLFDAAGKLLAKFLIVSNMPVADPRHIIAGNERVVRPRLQDARFFYEQDRKQPLESRVPALARVVYHNKLGSQLERVERIQLLAGSIARKLGGDVMLAERAAWLSKADLLTGMVGEFPELQGVMGRYYARHDGEPEAVADAVEAHYRPRFSGDRLPEGAVACAVALADKLDALAGLFGIDQAPTGDKDPFALRRAALGLVRILVEQRIAFPLPELIAAAINGFSAKPGFHDAQVDIENFVYERARHYFAELGYTPAEVEAVLCLRPARLDLVPKQLQAVRAFSAMPEAESLAAANKRIANILKQAGGAPDGFDAELLTLKEEKELAALFGRIRPQVERAFEGLDYAAGLRALASLKA